MGHFDLLKIRQSQYKLILGEEEVANVYEASNTFAKGKPFVAVVQKARSRM
jgi:hypothetical protein